MKSARKRSEPAVPITQTTEACVSRPSAARLLHASPAPDLGTLIADFHALVSHGASDVEETAAVAQIGRVLALLSSAEIEVLEKVARGMPARPAGLGLVSERPQAGRSRPPPAGVKESGKATFPQEDEDADPVGLVA
jgi:hypothetical protein